MTPPGRTRIYISGPMTGLPDYNRSAFNAEAARLRALGHHVENPAENPAPACGTWEGYMRLAIIQIAGCEELLMLPGWDRSRGACIEHRLAIDLGLSVSYLEGPPA